MRQTCPSSLSRDSASIRAVCAITTRRCSSFRSEEHTSELQSHSELVCRLFHETATTESYPLSLHDALPIFLVSGILFSIGFAGVMLRRNLIIILMSLELMLNAANLSLVAFSRFRVDPGGLPNYNAQVFVF